jgi:hypothetical protein
VAADRRLGEEEIVGRLRETFQISDTAEGFEVSKFNWRWFSFHNGRDIKAVSFELQGKIKVVTLPARTAGHLPVRIG